MPAPLATQPKITPRGTTRVTVEIDPGLRQDLIAIANRRGESLQDTATKALSQYVSADRRKHG